MKNTYLENWPETQKRFLKWWARKPMGIPLMRIYARGKNPENLTADEKFSDAKDMYLNVDKKIANYRNFCETHYFMADAYPSFSADIGPGSFAVYVGSEPVFTWDTVWFSEIMNDIRDQGCLKYDPDNKWWALHREMFKRAKELSNDEFLINIPDIVENIDILAALRGPQNLCYDLMDHPETVKEALDKLDSLYFTFYDGLHEITKEADGSSSYTAFAIWGPGRTAKVQCDFNVMMSPQMFIDLVVPGINNICDGLDNSIFHLDGPDAMKHARGVAKIKKLNALQWTPGAGQPDGGCEKWFNMYDILVDAGKNLWLAITDGGPDELAESAVRLVKRYGPDRLYLHFPIFESKEKAEALIKKVADSL